MVPGQQNLFSLDGHVALVTGASGVIVHVGLQDNELGLDTRRLTLQEIGFSEPIATGIRISRLGYTF